MKRSKTVRADRNHQLTGQDMTSVKGGGASPVPGDNGGGGASEKP